MFFKNKKINHSAKKIDKLITTVIIGSAIFGLSQTKKGKEITKDIKTDVNKIFVPFVKDKSKNVIGFFGKSIASLVGIFSKK